MTRVVESIENMEHLDRQLFMNYTLARPNSSYSFSGYDLYDGSRKLSKNEIGRLLMNFYMNFNKELNYMTNIFQAEAIREQLKQNIYSIKPLSEMEK